MPALSYDPQPFFKRGPTPLARFIFFGLLSLAMLFADGRYGYLENMRMGVAVVLGPFQRAAMLPGQAWDVMTAYFASQTRLSEENKQLKQQLLTQGAVVQSAQSLLQENERLRGLLQAHVRAAGNDILAEVLYLGRDPFSQKVYVNKGGANDVKAGQAVIDDAGVVGQVTRVYPAVSEVTLLTEKDHTIPVKVERNGVRTLLVGAGTGHAPELRFMAANADIQPGDVLVTSGLDGTYPPGLRNDPTYNYSDGDPAKMAKLNEALVYGAKKFLSKAIGKDPWGREYWYHIYTQGNPYQDVVVLSCGPDGAMNTWDGSVWNRGTYNADDIGAFYDQ